MFGCNFHDLDTHRTPKLNRLQAKDLTKTTLFGFVTAFFIVNVSISLFSVFLVFFCDVLKQVKPKLNEIKRENVPVGQRILCYLTLYINTNKTILNVFILS